MKEELFKEKITNTTLLKLIPETNEEATYNYYGITAKYYLISKSLALNDYVHPFENLKVKRVTVW